jgi:NAD(P)-dependent dehydrogenase (short-subunit alcohol dehydrogenase family)
VSDPFRYEGKRVLVVGAASGMGAAATRIAKDLGAEVVGMDYAPITEPGVTGIEVDLRDQASIDAAFAQTTGTFHAVLSCAGVADGTAGIERVNFLGQRHLLGRLVGEGRMAKGSAIGMISSVAGLGWERDLPELLDYLDTPDFAAAVAWHDAHPDHANYTWSKKAMCAYVARQAYPFLAQGVRINSIMPGPTDTPLARANADIWLAFAEDYRQATHITHSTPEEQAMPLLFLCSDAASYVNGVNIITDAGYVSAGLTGAWDAPFIKTMMGLD